MSRVTLRALTPADVEAHNAAEDAEVVRWLTGARGTEESTRRHFAQLAANAARGEGKRGFGVCLDGRLAGYVDCDPDNTDGTEPGDVNTSYTTHAWARRRGVATEAVALICDFLRDRDIGSRAVLRIEPENVASRAVAERAGFRFVREYQSETDTRPDGSAVTFGLYVRDL